MVYFVGHCNDSYNPPRCTDCLQGWMGPACDDHCTYGNQVPMDSGKCQCYPCYSGSGCDMECSNNGKCQGNKCMCDPVTGWRGSLCEVPGCPGDGKDCTGHGTCDSVNHKCICDPGRL